MNSTRIIQIYRLKCFRKVAPTGSRYICDPAPTDTDEDYVCLLPRNSELGHWILRYLNEADFAWDGVADERYRTRQNFWSFRKNDLNLIVTAREPFFDSFIKATEEAKRLNILDKKERIDFFNKMMYDVEYNQNGYNTDQIHPIPSRAPNQVLWQTLPQRRTGLRQSDLRQGQQGVRSSGLEVGLTTF